MGSDSSTTVCILLATGAHVTCDVSTTGAETSLVASLGDVGRVTLASLPLNDITNYGGKELKSRPHHTPVTDLLLDFFSNTSSLRFLSLMARLMLCSPSLALNPSLIFRCPNLLKTSHSMLVVRRRFSAARISMNLRAGIVGLPNVGKSTLFNAVVENGKAQAANFPFCTIEPNVGIVPVPDPRLNVLSELSKSQRAVPASIEFVDIAGLVKGASQGEGLGNKFLSHIREVDSILQVEKRMDKLKKGKAKDPQSKMKEEAEKSALGRIEQALMDGKPARSVTLTDFEKDAVRHLCLLTMKPVIYVANVAESDLAEPESNSHVKEVMNLASELQSEIVTISAQVEAELTELPPEERIEYLTSLGVSKSGLGNLIRATYNLLGLRTYFTSGEKFSLSAGMTAPQAAGVIHSDFERGFIRAETVAYNDFVAAGSLAAAREKGLLRSEGKDYVVREGDVMLFRFNV
ncbi:GTP-binding protein-related [Striga hermonthica]|uniref:GTP-binding protein-related n=1 Tax=Striga hermonthica TaxID=68872 RepID=A0A9N7NXF8_STRHE|nr:GTP-binding protein-related [Striga hermonthica]